MSGNVQIRQVADAPGKTNVAALTRTLALTNRAKRERCQKKANEDVRRKFE